MHRFYAHEKDTVCRANVSTTRNNSSRERVVSLASVAVSVVIVGCCSSTCSNGAGRRNAL